MKRFDIAALRRRGAQTFAGFTAGQKTMLALAGIAVVVGGFLFTRWSASPSWSPLYGNLAASDAASVTQELSAQGIPYKLSSGGTSILVPRDKVYQTRLDLSAKGLPSDGSPGYALLDKQGITTSEFRQRVDYQRALEGELARTIHAIDGVDAATVHLVIPVEDLFSEDQTKSTASVLVRTTGGQRLSSQQAKAIVHLVASSVQGLDPADVTVADAQGRIVAANADGLGGSDDGDEQTRAYEDSLATSLQAMLDRVTGDGHSVVRVRAELDFNRLSRVSESFVQPKTPLTFSEQSSKEVFKGSGSGNSSTLAAANAALPTNTDSSDYSKEEAQRQYAIGKVTEKLDAAPGTIKRLSVAVVVDSKVKTNRTELTRLVSAAAGLDTTRGDTLKVSSLAFDTTSQKAATAELARIDAARSRSELYGMIRAGVLVLLVFVALFIAYRSAKKSTVARIPIELPSYAEPAFLPMGGGGAARPDTYVAPVRRPLPEEGLAEMIESQPEDVAQTLRGWLADRRD